MCIYCDYCVYHYKSTELVSFIYIGYWTLNKYYYYYNNVGKPDVILNKYYYYYNNVGKPDVVPHITNNVMCRSTRLQYPTRGVDILY